MLVKLAARNVKRQLGNYLIYYITVSFTIALMFAFNNVIFSPDLAKKAQDASSLAAFMIAITVLVSLIVAFVLGYASSFLLKLRKREFGTYMTMGMSRKNIITVFLFETLIIGICSLITGIFFGLFLYQLVMSLLSKLMEISYTFSAYSSNGFLLTVGLVFAIFLLSSLTSAFYLNRVSIYHLIRGNRKNDKETKHPFIWIFVSIVSFISICVSIVAFLHETDRILHDTNALPAGILLCFLLLAVSIFFFHVGLARSITKLLLYNRKFSGHGTNTFVLRQLSSRLHTNSVMLDIVAFLIVFAVIGTNFAFITKSTLQASLDWNYPFDVLSNIEADAQVPVSPDQAETMIDTYSPVKSRTDFTVYTNNDNRLLRFTPWHGKRYESLSDSFLSESDYNRIQKVIGGKPVHLDNTFLICAPTPQIQSIDFSRASLSFDGKTYTYGGTLENAPYFVTKAYLMAIVPDEAIKNLQPQLFCTGMQLKNPHYDAFALEKELSYEKQSRFSDEMITLCDYALKESARLSMNESMGIFILSAFYVSIIFLFMAMSIFALKTLSQTEEDRQKYQILFQIGTKEKQRRKALFAQISIFFFLPFFLPVLFGIPCGIVGWEILQVFNTHNSSFTIIVICIMTALILTIIYVLYFIIAYLIAKRKIIQTI